jgi:hypothetical protein
MKNFISTLFLFLFPILIASYLADSFISNQLKKSNLFGGYQMPMMNELTEGKIKSDILIYGSSRAAVHIDPKMIDNSTGLSTWNLGADGNNFLLQYYRHSQILKYNHKPKLIIHSLDIFAFNSYIKLFNSEQFIPFMLFNKDLFDINRKYEFFKIYDFLIPLIRYRGNQSAINHSIDIYFNPQNNFIQRINGYKAEDKFWNNDFDNAKLKISKYKIDLNQELISLFETYIQECKNNKIKIIFVYSPEYIEGQKFILNRKDVFSLYTALSRKYSIPFYDFSNDSICLDKRYFYNSIHLNKTGANLFTNMLIDTLKKNNYFDFR